MAEPENKTGDSAPAAALMELYQLRASVQAAISSIEAGHFIYRDSDYLAKHWEFRIGDPGPVFRVGPFTVKREP